MEKHLFPLVLCIKKCHNFFCLLRERKLKKKEECNLLIFALPPFFWYNSLKLQVLPGVISYGFFFCCFTSAPRTISTHQEQHQQNQRDEEEEKESKKKEKEAFAKLDKSVSAKLMLLLFFLLPFPPSFSWLEM